MHTGNETSSSQQSTHIGGPEIDMEHFAHSSCHPNGIGSDLLMAFAAS